MKSQTINCPRNRGNSNAWLGIILNYSDRPREAIPMLEKAIRLNPNGPPFYFHNLGHTYRFLGRFPEAVGQYQKSLNVSPNNIFAHLGLTATYSQMGLDGEARAQARGSFENQPHVFSRKLRQFRTA